MSEPSERRYPELKERELQEHEKKEIRQRLERGDLDIYQIAREFSCSASQVAGIKAHLKK